MKKFAVSSPVVRLRRLLTPACLFFLILTGSGIAAAQDCPRELPVNISNRASPLPDNKLFTISVGEDTRQLLLHWDNLPDGPASSDQLPALPTRFAARFETILQAMHAAGFRIPPGGPHPCVAGNLIRVYLYQAPAGANSGGLASGNRFDLYFSQSSADRGTIFEDTMPTLLHEMFHLVQAQYRIGAIDRKWLSEGTATLASDVFDASLDNSGSVGDDNCRRQVLRDPFRAMFRRHSKFGDGTNACQPVVFWRYLTEQLGADLNEPGAGIGLIHELYEFLESTPALPAWRTAATDRIHGAGDFDGDGRHELLIASPTHLGLIASTEAESRVLAVRAFGLPIAGNWTLRANDQILGVGDFDSDGRDEFLIRNAGFMALIGTGQSGRLRAIAGVPLGTGVFADWRPEFRDQLIAIGDFDGDGADEAMFRGRSRIGIMRIDRSGQFVSPLSTSVVRLIRRLNRNPAAVNVIGTGDIDGDGRDEIVARDERGLFVWGLNEEDRHQLLFSADYGEHLGNGWRLDREDSFLGVRDLDGTVNDGRDDPGLRAEIIVTSRNGLGVIGLNAFSRQLEIKTVLAIGAGLGADQVYGANTRPIAMGELLGPTANQIVLRDRNTLTVLAYTYETPASGILEPVASLTVERGALAPMRELRSRRLDRGRLEGRFNIVDRSFISDVTGAMTAALSGAEGAHLLTRGPDRLLSFKTITEPDASGLPETKLLLDYSDIDGRYQKSLVAAVDAFIQSKDPTRSLDSMWHDLSVMLLVKNSVGQSMGERFILRDEMPPGIAVDADADSQTPPVALVTRPIKQTTDSSAAPVVQTTEYIARPFSARYHFLEPVSYPRQVDLSFRTLTGAGGHGVSGHFGAVRFNQPAGSSISTVIAGGSRPPLPELGANNGDDAFVKRYTLYPHQWMGIVVSTSDAVPMHHLGVRVERLPVAD